MNQHNFISIAGPNQFALRIPYHADGRTARGDYRTNLYFFIPKILNINPETYPVNLFYNDYISYIRIILPARKLGALERRLEHLIASLKQPISHPDARHSFDKELKLIVSSYGTYLDAYGKAFAHQTIRCRRLHTFLARVEKLHALMAAMLRHASEHQSEAIADSIASAMEYLSYSAQNSLLEINVRLGTYEDQYRDTIKTIIGIINTIIAASKANGFPVISNDAHQNEKVIYRHTILQKHFDSIVHLYQKKKRDGGGIKEIYYAIAAGISMVFTTLIVFATQKEYGNLTTSFFAALVISYMFKDRIKEAYRGYFDKRMAIKTYDYKEKIYSTDHALIFARIKERMRFVAPGNLDESIQKTRLLEVPRRLIAYLEEDIIRFEKRVTLHKKNIQRKYHHTVKGIDNIMQFDISQYVKKMDAAKVPLFRFNERKLFGNRIYHVNILIENKTPTETERLRARIILNKNGIKRIEIPGTDTTIYPEESLLVKQKNWFSLKKSGLLRKARKPHQNPHNPLTFVNP